MDLIVMSNTIFEAMSGMLGMFPPVEVLEHDMTPYLATLARWSGLLGASLAVLVSVLLLLMNRRGRVSRLQVSGRGLTTSFFVVWLAGFVVYDVGLYITHSPWSLLANVPMATIHAFEMFLLHSDAAAIHKPFHENWIFMGIFSLVHLLAAVVTLVFVLKHFGYNIVAGFRMLFEAYLPSTKRETYVFWGMNDASYLLANSIRKHYGNQDKDYRIIVVRTNHDGQGKSVRNGMERLFNFLSLRNNDLERLLELDCLTTSTYTDLIHLSLDGLDANGYADILRRHLDLGLLARIISRKTSGSVHLFFLTDNDNDNIQAVGNMKRDKTIASLQGNGKSATLYCKARYNSVHRVIEDEQIQEHLTVKVVDPSHISIEMLKQDVRLQPVSFVDINADGTVSSDFNALVVGFGEVGYDTVSFLYEFGAFVKPGSGNGKVERSGFRCDVIDKDIKQRAGLYAVNAPSISRQMSYDQLVWDQITPITLHDLNINSVDFYNHIESMIKTLNYVVIALDDDEQNVSLAVRIFRLAVRYRKDLNHFRILARVRDDKGGHLLKITQHYNRLWAAQACSDAASRHFHQREVRNTDQINEPITLFGSMASTYTWDYIVSDRLKNEAKRFKERYDQSIMAMNATQDTVAMTPLEWESEHRDLMQLTDEYRGFSPTFSGIMRLRRIQRQNKANCFHQLTKRFIAQAALSEEDFALIGGHHLTRQENETRYHWQNHTPVAAVEKVLEVLAQTEHLRWMASHEILGYREDDTEDDKDEARLMHGCLRPWQELSERVRSYDYNVVDVSLGII